MSVDDLHGLLAPYLTRERLAEQLDVTVRTLDRWRSEGKGPPVTFKGITPLYRIESVEAWLRSCEKPMPRERRRA